MQSYHHDRNMRLSPISINRADLGNWYQDRKNDPSHDLSSLLPLDFSIKILKPWIVYPIRCIESHDKIPLTTFDRCIVIHMPLKYKITVGRTCYWMFRDHAGSSPLSSHTQGHRAQAQRQLLNGSDFFSHKAWPVPRSETLVQTLTISAGCDPKLITIENMVYRSFESVITSRWLSRSDRCDVLAAASRAANWFQRHFRCWRTP